MKTYEDLILAVSKIDNDAAIWLRYDARLLNGFKEDSLLSCCFHWSDTPQGSDYWAKIAGKLYDARYEEESSETDTPTALDFLTAASGHMKDRVSTYDSPKGERSMGKAVLAFNSVTGYSLKESDGWLLLQLLKDTRQWSREHYHADSAEDCIAFAALKAEALAKEDTL